MAGSMACVGEMSVPVYELDPILEKTLDKRHAF